MKRAALLLLAALFLAGCASTIEDRRKEHFAAYTAMPPEMQALVDQRQIKVGMPKDAVYIAWGKPEQVIQGESEQGRTETWIYYGSTLRPYQYWNYGAWGPYYRGWYYNSPLPYVETDYYPASYPKAEVTFQNDRVATWRHLPHAPY
ncbi:MAG TPA: hypothetical protein VK850_01390 [Candidatus Binatia bacterium]|nr:hypothetical protein [Candidatus Binatia bacterium]